MLSNYCQILMEMFSVQVEVCQEGRPRSTPPKPHPSQANKDLPGQADQKCHQGELFYKTEAVFKNVNKVNIVNEKALFAANRANYQILVSCAAGPNMSWLDLTSCLVLFFSRHIFLSKIGLELK